MTGVELWTSGIESDQSTNWATTTSLIKTLCTVIFSSYEPFLQFFGHKYKRIIRELGLGRSNFLKLGLGSGLCTPTGLAVHSDQWWLEEWGVWYWLLLCLKYMANLVYWTDAQKFNTQSGIVKTFFLVSFSSRHKQFSSLGSGCSSVGRVVTPVVRIQSSAKFYNQQTF